MTLNQSDDTCFPYEADNITRSVPQQFQSSCLWQGPEKHNENEKSYSRIQVFSDFLDGQKIVRKLRDMKHMI